MREILFRGKSACGAWVRGDLINRKIWHSEFQVIRTDDSGFDNYTEYEVITDTVGQYTGLTDKNGKKIFEGDIVEGLFRFHLPVNSVVAYSEGSFGLLWDRGGVETFWAFPTICNVEYEVIGNIHDHPELLKGGEG